MKRKFLAVLMMSAMVLAGSTVSKADDVFESNTEKSSEINMDTEEQTEANPENAISTLKEIAGYFENVFSIDIGDLYHSYLEMRSRKINRTRYLETLQKSLLRRMDENDT